MNPTAMATTTAVLAVKGTLHTALLASAAAQSSTKPKGEQRLPPSPHSPLVCQAEPGPRKDRPSVGVDLLQAARDVGAGRVRFISSRRIALVLRLIYALATEGAFFLSRLGKAEDKAIMRYDLGKESKYCCRHSLWG
ncbi:hypothetical protein BHM03_00024929 [Ensete ventricosum]|nr:hypothetical protein BHM03_00024929 [Ensete ventricosum]